MYICLAHLVSILLNSKGICKQQYCFKIALLDVNRRTIVIGTKALPAIAYALAFNINAKRTRRRGID